MSVGTREAPATAVVMCFDLEPEDRASLPRPGGPISWGGVEETIEIVDSFRDRLTDLTGSPAHFAWFLRMDPAIEVLHGDASWAAQRFGPQLEALRRKGDTLGLHTHAHRWDEALDDWVVEHGDRAWMQHCLSTAFTAFAASFGEPCVVNRIGDWFMSNETMRELESRGVLVDLTVEPGQRPVETNTPEHAHTGRLPDYTRAELGPYRPSRHDFRRAARDDEDAGSVWEVPILAADLRPRTSLPRRALRFARYPGRPPFRPWPLWSDIPGAEFWSLVQTELASRRHPVAAFATRSHTPVMPGGRQALTDKFEALLSHSLGARARLETPVEVLRRLGLLGEPVSA